MNVTPEGTIAVPLESVRREINYAWKIAKSSKQREDANVVHLLNVVQRGRACRSSSGSWSGARRPRLPERPRRARG